MKINKNEVGSRIKDMRRQKGMTMEEFGEAIDKKSPASDSIVSRWERGISLPSNDRLPKIAELSNMSVNELLYGDFSEEERESVDSYLLKKTSEYVEERRETRKIDWWVVKGSAKEFLKDFSIIWKNQDNLPHIKMEKEHHEKFDTIEKETKKEIQERFNNYTFEKYLKDYPNKDSVDFQLFKEKEWKEIKKGIDLFIDIYQYLNQQTELSNDEQIILDYLIKSSTDTISEYEPLMNLLTVLKEIQLKDKESDALERLYPIDEYKILLKYAQWGIERETNKKNKD